MTLPQSLKILGMDWSVVSASPSVQEQGLAGEASYTALQIRLDTALPLGQQRETLIHELFHALCLMLWVEEDRLKEPQIRALSVGWHQVLRENKALMEFLRDGQA